MRDRDIMELESMDCQGGLSSLWHMRRYVDSDSERYEEFLFTVHFQAIGTPSTAQSSAHTVKVVGHMVPCGAGSGASGDAGEDEVCGEGEGVDLVGELTKVALRMEHRDLAGGDDRFVYRSERFVAEGDGQFRGVWMCGARTGRFTVGRRKSTEEPRKRKSACRRKADAEIKSKRFFNELKDELRILERPGWTEKRWKEESKLEKGRAILHELRRELHAILDVLRLDFPENTPLLYQVERGIVCARRLGNVDVLRRLRALDCSHKAPVSDVRSDWHTLFEIQRHFAALPPVRATKYTEPSNLRHHLRCVEVGNAQFSRGLFLGGSQRLCDVLLRMCWPTSQADHRRALLDDLRSECIAGERGVREAFDITIHLIVRSGGSEFIWQPGGEVKLHLKDRVYYEQAHVWTEERRCRMPLPGKSVEESARRLLEFETLLTGGRPDLVSEEDFEYVEMTARAECGVAEGVPAFLEHSVSGDIADAQKLFDKLGQERGWGHRPKALSLGRLFKTKLAGYRRQRTREIVWGPSRGLYWERGDRPLRLLRMAQEPVRVTFCKHEEPYGFHLHDVRSGAGGTEVAEVVDGSAADARGVVVGRTVKRLSYAGGSEDVRNWTRDQIQEAIQRMTDRFTIEFGKGDTEERRHAPLCDAEMAILMDERFMRGFLHELQQEGVDGPPGKSPTASFDQEGWSRIFPGLEASSASSGALAQPPQAMVQPARIAEAAPPRLGNATPQKPQGDKAARAMDEWLVDASAAAQAAYSARLRSAAALTEDSPGDAETEDGRPLSSQASSRSPGLAVPSTPEGALSAGSAAAADASSSSPWADVGGYAASGGPLTMWTFPCDGAAGMPLPPGMKLHMQGLGEEDTTGASCGGDGQAHERRRSWDAADQAASMHGVAAQAATPGRRPRVASATASEARSAAVGDWGDAPASGVGPSSPKKVELVAKAACAMPPLPSQMVSADLGYQQQLAAMGFRPPQGDFLAFPGPTPAQAAAVTAAASGWAPAMLEQLRTMTHLLPRTAAAMEAAAAQAAAAQLARTAAAAGAAGMPQEWGHGVPGYGAGFPLGAVGNEWMPKASPAAGGGLGGYFGGFAHPRGGGGGGGFGGYSAGSAHPGAWLGAGAAQPASDRPPRSRRT